MVGFLEVLGLRMVWNDLLRLHWCRRNWSPWSSFRRWRRWYFKSFVYSLVNYRLLLRLLLRCCEFSCHWRLFFNYSTLDLFLRFNILRRWLHFVSNESIYFFRALSFGLNFGLNILRLFFLMRHRLFLL